MKKIEATLVSYLVEDVAETLNEHGFNGMTMTRVINMRKEHMEPRIGDLYPDPPTDYRVKIEIVATDDQVEQFVKIIQGVAGKHPRHNSREYGNEIFIFPVDEAIRIRTGETGDKAI